MSPPTPTIPRRRKNSTSSGDEKSKPGRAVQPGNATARGGHNEGKGQIKMTIKSASGRIKNNRNVLDKLSDELDLSNGSSHSKPDEDGDNISDPSKLLKVQIQTYKINLMHLPGAYSNGLL